MPIVPKFEPRSLSQQEFGEVAYEVMNHVFAIHNDMGRLFDEQFYKRELFDRLPDVMLEPQVDVIYESVKKPYFADVIVGDSALFEIKAAENIHNQHINQTIHYLRLFDLSHGKVINTRPEQVESQFVNCHQRLADLRNPEIDNNSDTG